LALPDPQHLPELGALARYAAVALFVQRALAVKPDFQVTNANAAAVAEICVRLDGLPLAIELAAARSKLFPPEALLARLSSRLGLLTGGRQDAPARHQTLRAALDWSYRLLDESEQRLFRWLSVFVGGWTLEAAEAVAGGSRGAEGPSDRGDDGSGTATGTFPSSSLTSGPLVSLLPVLDGLQSLVDKSLVRQVEGSQAALPDARRPTSDPRFTMLETIREYALEQLAASGEAEAIERRHARFFLQFAETAEPELFGPQQATWFDRLEAEHDNLRAALRWSLAHGETMLALRMSGALWRFWYTHGYLSEGRTWLESALAAARRQEMERPGSRLPSPTARPLAKALHAGGLLAHYQSDYSRARTLFEEALALWRLEEDTYYIASVLQQLAAVVQNQREYGRATTLYEESLRLCRQIGHTSGAASALYGLGSLAIERQDYVRATALCEESLQLYRQLGDKGSMAAVLTSLGEVARQQGDLRRATALFEEGLALYQEVRNGLGIAWALGNLGYVALAQGDYGRAGALFEQNQALARDLGNKAGVAFGFRTRGEVAHAEGDDHRAAQLFADGLTLYQEVGDKLGIAQSLERLAAVALNTEGGGARAARLWGTAEALREAVGAPISPAKRTAYERDVAAARAQLDEEAFAAAWAEGRAMPLEQAIACALRQAS
ncbi:MAG: tetratricopeptide repeat protein, partial [Chloroflexota bacterium]|nr:tetratricopeptide repeat protein [Chloroflexota bacterium]